MSKILKGVYHGRDTEILELDYFDDEKGTYFAVRCLDFDIVLGYIPKTRYGDIENARQTFDYFNSLLPTITEDEKDE